MARALLLGGLLLLCLNSSRAADFDLEDTRAKFIAGQYEEVIEESRAALKARLRQEDWHLLLARSLWITGQYPEAREAISLAERANYYSVRTRLYGYHINRSAGDLETALAPEHLDPTIQTQVMYSRSGYALSLHKTCYHTDNNGQGTYHFDDSYSWSSHEWISDLTDHEIHHHVYSEIINQNDTSENAQLLAYWQP